MISPPNTVWGKYGGGGEGGGQVVTACARAPHERIASEAGEEDEGHELATHRRGSQAPQTGDDRRQRN
eukprot:8573274-Pyramimonas_sp.AAC.1